MNSSRKPAAIDGVEEDPGREIADAVVAALDEVKAVDVRVLDVRGKTPLTDYLVVASGNSDRHLATLKDAVLKCAAGLRVRPLGVEGEAASEWILIDLADCVVHLMRPATRAFYDIERLWSVGAATPEPAGSE